MSSKNEICNMAISHLGVGQEIIDIETERSAEALACKVFYDKARRIVLSAHEWSFAYKNIALNLVEEDPIDGWDFSYLYPVDCLYFRGISQVNNKYYSENKIPYELANDGTRRVIYTNEDQAYGEYTFDNEDISQWSEELQLSLSYLLAFYIAPKLTAGDPMKIKSEMLQLYRQEILNAKTKNLSESEFDTIHESDSIKVRY